MPVDVVTEEQVLEFVREHVETRSPAQIVTVNAEFVMRSQADSEFARVIRGAQLATPDGAGVVWAMNRQGARINRRVGGSDLIWSISQQAAQRGHRVFLLGGRSGVAEAAARRLLDINPGLQLVGAYSGSPSHADEESIVDLVRTSMADILFVAFGAPQQDVWIGRNLERTGVSIGIGVGGSFDYLAGTARRAPIWMQDHGLDWLWRLIRQPWRWRRMTALPRFAWNVWREGRTPVSRKG
ncbi:MAG TPA: WecB/TagA/CpsF family glycosyltransferase [Chloroflexota bacterium]